MVWHVVNLAIAWALISSLAYAVVRGIAEVIHLWMQDCRRGRP